jgi:hypothetical protein
MVFAIGGGGISCHGLPIAGLEVQFWQGITSASRDYNE